MFNFKRTASRKKDRAAMQKTYEIGMFLEKGSGTRQKNLLLSDRVFVIMVCLLLFKIFVFFAIGRRWLVFIGQNSGGCDAAPLFINRSAPAPDLVFFK